MGLLTNVFDERQWLVVTSYGLLVASFQSAVIIRHIANFFMNKFRSIGATAIRNKHESEKVFSISLSP